MSESRLLTTDQRSAVWAVALLTLIGVGFGNFTGYENAVFMFTILFIFATGVIVMDLAEGTFGSGPGGRP